MDALGRTMTTRLPWIYVRADRGRTRKMVAIQQGLLNMYVHRWYEILGTDLRLERYSYSPPKVYIYTRTAKPGGIALTHAKGRTVITGRLSPEQPQTQPRPWGETPLRPRSAAIRPRSLAVARVAGCGGENTCKGRPTESFHCLERERWPWRLTLCMYGAYQ